MNKKIDKATGEGRKKFRCAIYTRKSSEEGLEQDFNSLDAQREACEAYIASQKHEGWTALREMYDDGGFSGATIDRPAFQQLLFDVTAGKIDVVVVYKVDRLTRSLSDFAKIVEIFDKRGVSFVSVTQQFNTTTSMGRLTLNILLSFAQFEREVTGERIRDKIAASKKKGMWMGGQPPLGYDANDKKLVINEAEAKTVRSIFRRYVELISVRLLKAELDERGIISKLRKASDGSDYGGNPLARGALYLMLQNRIYRGEIVHKGKSYIGEHEAIVDEVLWNEVQAILTNNRIDRTLGRTEKQPSLLSGLLYGANGERLVPTHTAKNGVRYRYYVSSSLTTGKSNDAGLRIPATNLETLVRRRICSWLANRASMLNLVQTQTTDIAVQKQFMKQMDRFVATWDELGLVQLRKFFFMVVARIEIHNDRINIELNQKQLVQWFSDPDSRSEPIVDIQSEAEDDLATLTVLASFKRAGGEMKVIVADRSDPASPDSSLIRLLVRAHAVRDRLMHDKSLTLDEIAKSERIVPSYATRLFRLTLLAPDIVGAILDGKQPPELNARRLIDSARLPLDWREQRQVLGFA